jgi:hypothetical protein
VRSRFILIVNDNRAEAFTRIFGRNRVPVESDDPEVARLPRIGRIEVYKIDLSVLSADERQRLADYLASVWDMPSERVEEEIARGGVPIRAEGTTLIDTDPVPDFA